MVVTGAIRGTHGRERLAWLVLFSSFFVCVATAAGAPLLARAYFQNARQPLVTSVLANEGTIRIEESTGLRRAILAGEPAQEAGPSATIFTDVTDSGLLLVASPQSGQAVAQVQVYSNSSVRLLEATAPRFALSSRERSLEMELAAGRLQLSLLENQDRALNVRVHTPHGAAAFAAPGLYALEVDSQLTEVSVQEGSLLLEAFGGNLELTGGERGQLRAESVPVGPLDPQRDLIQNGDFVERLEHWSLFTWSVERADQEKGTTQVRDLGGDPVLHLARDGVGHADVRLLQTINHDVTGYQRLELNLTFRILRQSLGVCGVRGSECPIFIRLNYLDEDGLSRTWQQGFYAEGTVDNDTTPGACVPCAVVQRGHEFATSGDLHFYAADVRDELGRQGALPPRLIESIELVFSGHSFEVEVVDVSLLVED